MRLPDDFQKRLAEHEKQVPRIESIYAVIGIYHHLSNAVEFAQCGEQVFLGSAEKQAAISHSLMSAGEAAKQFCDLHEGSDRKGKARLEQPNEDIERVPLETDQWSALHKLRDRLAHNPTNPEPASVWEFVSSEVPPLLPILRRVVSHLDLRKWRACPEPMRTWAALAVANEFERKCGHSPAVMALIRSKFAEIFSAAGRGDRS